MKKLFLLLILLIAVQFVQAAEEIRSLDQFDEVVLSISGKVYLEQGSKHQVIINGTDDQLEKIETKVRNNILYISLGNPFNRLNTRNLEITVTLVDLAGIKVTGSGAIIAEKQLIAEDQMEVVLSGSGSVQLNLATRHLKSTITGSGKMVLDGTSESHQVVISGSGSMQADDFSSENYDVRITGSGSCRINVQESIEASITGSGSVYYLGNPSRIESKVTGSGRIRKVS